MQHVKLGILLAAVQLLRGRDIFLSASDSAELKLSSSLSTGPLKQQNSTNGHLLQQTAPYAVDDNQAASEGESKNVIFRLTLNQTLAGHERSGSGLENTDHQWTLVGPNGTVLGERASLDLKKLLDTLNSNNLFSEVHFDDDTPGLVNITISRRSQEGGRSSSNNDSGPIVNNRDHDLQARELLLLEDLLDESKYKPTLNLSSVMRDNHRLVARQPARSRPPGDLTSAGLTVPPIHRNQDVVAENYTAKKVANDANIFALRLLEQLNIERLGNENIIQSPFSIYQGLALLLSGSMGDTSRELDRLLLSTQSVYENTKLTHDQDRARLMASFGEAVRQLQHSSTNHCQSQSSKTCTLDTRTDGNLSLDCDQLSTALGRAQYRGGSQEQHYIVANNLLFSPGAYEISNEFKSTLNAFYNNTGLTKMEVGSRESIQLINGWIRQATAGLIPAIMSKRSTFDEFNVMTLLSTSWLAQEWRNSFRKISSSLRSNIRLKGQAPVRDARELSLPLSVEPLMEFVDDQKTSHFVDYIKSEPTRSIHNYHIYLNKQLSDVVVVPFMDSNQRLVAITPLVPPSQYGNSIMNSIQNQLHQVLNNTLDVTSDQDQADASVNRQQLLAESSQLSKMIANFASEPRRVLNQLWNTIAPEIITKQTLLSMQSAVRASMNSTGTDERALLNAPAPPKVQLSMPIIRLEADSSLSASLNHVGLVNAFDSAQANFIGINGHPFNYNKLHLSNVIYKTTFNLNEAGINYDRTVRTLESMRVLPQRQQQRQQQQQQQEMELEKGELVNEVKLNKPFLFLICDVKAKLILYTGVVRNPAK